MTTIPVSASMTAPFFLIDVAPLIPDDMLQEIVGVSQLTSRPAAIIASVGLALSPTTNLVQAISGIAYCNAPNSVVLFTILTRTGTTILLLATWNGRTNINVRYGTT